MHLLILGCLHDCGSLPSSVVPVLNISPDKALHCDNNNNVKLILKLIKTEVKLRNRSGHSASFSRDEKLHKCHRETKLNLKTKIKNTKPR